MGKLQILLLGGVIFGAMTAFADDRPSCPANVLSKRSVPSSLAAFGDSITAATLANFGLDEFFPGGINRATRALKTKPSAAAQGKVLAAELTRFLSTSSFAALDAYKKFSWFGGTAIPSQYTRIKALRRRLRSGGALAAPKIEAYPNAASAQMVSQVSSITGKVFPQYTAIFVGVNDLTTSRNGQNAFTPVADFKNNLREAVLAIKAKRPDAFVMIPLIPEGIADLFETAKDEVPLNAQLAQAVLLKSSATSLIANFLRTGNCRELRGTLPYLPRAIAGFGGLPPADLDEVRVTLAEYNQAIVELVNELRSESVSDADRIGCSNRSRDIPLSADFLAADCFHPNARAQQALSDAVWADSWWSAL